MLVRTAPPASTALPRTPASASLPTKAATVKVRALHMLTYQLIQCRIMQLPTCLLAAHICDVSHCYNGGSCDYSANDERGYMCTCADGYEGMNCESEYTCSTNLCMTRYIMLIAYCSFCLVETDECETEPCMNHLFCLDEVADRTCVCQPGWEGRSCESKTVCLKLEDGENSSVFAIVALVCSQYQRVRERAV